MKLCGQVNLVPAVLYVEIRHTGRAIGYDLIERPLKLSCRGQRAGDSIEHAEFRIFVSVRTGDCRVTGVLLVPWAEFPRGMDFTGRLWVEQRHIEGKRVFAGDVMQRQSPDFDSVRFFCRRVLEYFQKSSVRDEGVNLHSGVRFTRSQRHVLKALSIGRSEE